MPVLIPIIVHETAGIERDREPVRIGVPLPRGLVFDSTSLRLKDEQAEELPFQSRVLAFWPDRSVKWVLIDFFASVPAYGRVVHTVDRGGPGFKEPAGFRGVVLAEDERCFTVDTGAAMFTVPRDRLALLSGARVNGVDALGHGTDVRLLDRAGRECPAKIEEAVAEESGSQLVTLRTSGRFANHRGKPLVRFSARTTFFAGLSLVQVDFQVHNPQAALHPGGLWDLGDPGSVNFKDLSIQFALNQNSPERIVSFILNEALHPHHPPTADTLESCTPSQNLNTPDPQGLKNTAEWTAHREPFVIYQDSSGGENWNSTNHIDCKGAPTVSFRGYRVTAAMAEGGQGVIREGLRAAPVLRVDAGPVWIAAAVDGFWQNFPKALRAQEGRLEIGMFPSESASGFELQGGEAKRHRIFLEFGAAGEGSCLRSLLAPLRVHLAPSSVEASGVIPWFSAQAQDPNTDYCSCIRRVIEGPGSFFSKREVIDEFGWRNFGDVYADHEAVNHQGPGPFISHYNNQYDFIHGALVHFLRSGDSRWWELARDLARHVADIDIYHTDEDKAAYNHGMFWHTDHYRDAGTCTHRSYSRRNGRRGYGGGPSNENNYTSGLLLFHYLTGDAAARKAVIELADWVLAMDDGARSLCGLIDEGPTGLASQTVDPNYHHPGRGAGNSINALCDGYRLTGRRGYLAKAEELIQRCIHPSDEISELKLVQDPEYRWSYLVFLQVLGKYLDLKSEIGETDYYFFYARDSLLHYADWMAENERPYQELLDRVEIPTETWPAHDIRKCHIFHLASVHGPPERREDYIERAGFFFERCLNDLLTWNTVFLTRPLVILTVYGYVHAYFSKFSEPSYSFVRHGYGFGEPQRYTPHRERLKDAVKRKWGIIMRLSSFFVAAKFYALRAHIGKG